MNKALIYRVRGRWLIWMAFGCAAVIHLTAIVLAENRSRPAVADLTEPGADVVLVDGPQEPPAQEPDIVPTEQVPPPPDEDAFSQENATPPAIRHKKTPVARIVRSTGAGTIGALRLGSAKALLMYGPRPDYPYEARRERMTGSGVAELTVNTAAGNVIDAQMAQSTGSALLDKTTLEALRRWRFKPDSAEHIKVPITYTLTGVSY